MPPSTTMFGSDAAQFVAMVDSLGLTSYRTRYPFASPEGFQQTMRDRPEEGVRIYWEEILARAHLTAVTALLRSRQWVAAVIGAAQGGNALAFAAAFRGLIESAADASDALLAVPVTLARDHQQITQALSGSPGWTAFLNAELEEQLIHYWYARHLTHAELASVPVSHRARNVRDYVSVLERGQVARVVECYRALCDMTHPGAASVWMWLHPVGELEIILEPCQDRAVISNMVDEYRDTFLELLMFAFNPAIVTLRVLGYFPLPEFHVPGVMDWDLSGVKLWQKCREQLPTPLCRGSGPGLP